MISEGFYNINDCHSMTRHGAGVPAARPSALPCAVGARLASGPRPGLCQQAPARGTRPVTAGTRPVTTRARPAAASVVPRHHFQMLLQLWGLLYSSCVRFWLKWVVRLLTGKCELQRVLHGQKEGARRTLGIEHSLGSSKNKVLRNALHVDEAEVEKCVKDVMKEKKIEHKDIRFKTNLHISLLQITGYKKLYLNVENLRKVPYDSDNEEHEEQLIELWNLLMPHENLKARITKQWCDIGFQGDDPKTDFRGMGLLGLVNLVYFSKHYTNEARQILSRSNHPKLGYSYAIVGINLTEMAYSLLKSGDLKPHLYNVVSGLPQMEHFHQFYCYLVYEFDKFWFEEEPESIMHFNQYREKFHEKIKGLLLDYDAILTLGDKKKP